MVERRVSVERTVNKQVSWAALSYIQESSTSYCFFRLRVELLGGVAGRAFDVTMDDAAAREDNDGSPAAAGRLAVSELGSLDASE